ncbi:phenylalanine--tRNA ligase subunit beta [Candidatus Woesearchaeota archaeon CG_4_10_14_0_2_um_filter_33_13]|nr:MAG: phenylalanine--tRNA ligase subunit beta [Candidatus Woesearchaeota archaeon CG_4_10_14_0_2_um_filter_33_13]
MPTIILNKEVFEKLVGKKLPLDQLKDRISMLGTDLEKIEGNEIEVEIFPNRPDLLSEQGFARAFSSFIGVKTGLRKYDVKKSGLKVYVDKNIKNIRPYTVCAIIRGLKFDDEKIREIVQVQEKLHTTFCRNRKKAAIGIYPLENIKMPIYFKAMKSKEIKFRPLESEIIMDGLQILSKHPKGRDYAHLLEGLEMFPVFMDSNQEILSLTPIINSHLTGKVTKKTKDIFIEFSGFDLEAQKVGLNMLVTIFAEMGGKIESLEVIYPDKTIVTPNLTPSKMKLDLTYVNKLLGLSLKEKEVKDLLERMGYGYEKEEVLVPAYRVDILHQVDLAEDIAIAYGYENFEETIPNVATIGEENSLEKLQNKIRDILIGLRLLEVKNYHLITNEDLTIKMQSKNKVVALKNSLGEHNHLRNSILPSLLKVLKDNQHNEYPQDIFELGRTFNFDKKEETGVKEEDNLAIMLCHDKSDYTEIKQVLDALISALGLEYKIKESNQNSFISGRAGEIIVQNTKIGMIGEISPEVLELWGLVVPAVALEINLETIFKIIISN